MGLGRERAQPDLGVFRITKSEKREKSAPTRRHSFRVEVASANILPPDTQVLREVFAEVDLDAPAGPEESRDRGEQALRGMDWVGVRATGGLAAPCRSSLVTRGRAPIRRDKGVLCCRPARR